MKRKILVADDDQGVRRVMERALERESYEPITADDGVEALAAVAERKPDAVLLDIEMPRKDGLEVLRELRRGAATRTLPVILMTGLDSPRDTVEGLHQGADDYVTKPCDIEELKARLASLLRRCDADLSANPLTRLPGNPQIEQEAARRLARKERFAFLYADVNHFKPYNDVYGFERGDAAIRETARVLVESVRAVTADAFVGHIGGDDFVAIVPAADAAAAAQRAAIAFDEMAPGLYEAEDRRRGGLRARDRDGRWRTFPLLSLSIGVAVAEEGYLDEYSKLARVAAEMKAWCKEQPERGLSRFGFDRRKR